MFGLSSPPFIEMSLFPAGDGLGRRTEAGPRRVNRSWGAQAKIDDGSREFVKRSGERSDLGWSSRRD